MSKPSPAGKPARIGRCSRAMIDLCKLIWCAFARLFRSRAELEAEILVLRHQLNVLRRKSPGRLAFSSIDRVVFAGMYALAPNILDALKIVNRKPCSVGIVRIPGLLALEIATTGRAAEYSSRDLRPHSRDEHCQPASLIGRSGSSAFRLSTTSSVDVARGLALLFGIGTEALPAWDLKTRWNNLWGGLAVKRR